MGQFSMDFFDDHLRVATSSNARYGIFPIPGENGEENQHREWKQLDPAKSKVTILKEEDGTGTLVATGQLDDLGVDGTISSVRFLGERGYVTSWQDGDPLFVLDLSDPSNPVRTGRIDVEDRLNFMHPMNPEGTKLLAVGSATTTTPSSTGNYDYDKRDGIRISVFDVSDPASPVEQHSYVFETIGTSSALSDHHAFRFVPEIGQLIIPGYERSWRKKVFFDGTWRFKIDEINGIEELGEIRHAGVNEMTNWFCWSPNTLPSRSMMFNGNLLTMQSHTVMMTRGDEVSDEATKINLDEGRNEIDNDDCSEYNSNQYYYGGW
jgi:hypothetical protein